VRDLLEVQHRRVGKTTLAPADVSAVDVADRGAFFLREMQIFADGPYLRADLFQIGWAESVSIFMSALT